MAFERTSKIGHYQWLSTDTPTTAGIEQGSIGYETDTKKWYRFNGTAWVADDSVETSVVIANGATTSGAFNKGHANIIGLVMPAAFTGATISFMVSTTLAGTYQVLRDVNDVVVSVPVTQGTSKTLNGDTMTALAPWQFIKIVSSGAEGGDRTIGIRAVRL
jgi:hypothetical protein